MNTGSTSLQNYFDFCVMQYVCLNIPVLAEQVTGRGGVSRLDFIASWYPSPVIPKKAIFFVNSHTTKTKVHANGSESILN